MLFRLDEVINDKAFFHHKIFAASEGTLGILTSARLKIIDIPLYRYLIVVGFEDLLSAISVVPLILKYSPVALEMLDSTVVRHREENSNINPQFQNEETGCLLFIEFAGDKLSGVEQAFDSCSSKLSDKCTIIESAADELSLIRMWGARKNALNQAMKLTVGSRKPIGLIEDTVVPPDMLYDHTQQLLQMYSENKLDYVIYGHAGDGNLHTRPLIEVGSQAEPQLMDHLAIQLQLLLLAQEDEMAKLLMTVPGIGYYSALLIVSEVGDINSLTISFMSSYPSMFLNSTSLRNKSSIIFYPPSSSYKTARCRLIESHVFLD